MPRIPSFIGPSVDPQGGGSQPFQAPGVAPMGNGTPEQTDAIGRGAMALGAAVSSIANKFQDEQDEALATDRDNKLADTIRRVQLDPTTGFLNTEGGDAMGDRRAKADEEIQAARKDLAASLKTPMQQKLFARSADDRLRRAAELHDRHVAMQSRTFAVGAADAKAKTEIADALVAGVGTADFAKRRELALASINKLADLGGASPEERELLIRTKMAPLHEGAVRQLVDEGNAKGAEAYLNGVTGGEHDPAAPARPASGLDPQKAADLRRLVRGALRDSRGRELAQGAEEKAPGDLLAQFDLIDGDETATDDERDNAIARAVQRDSIAHTTETRAHAQLLENGTLWLRQNRGTPITPETNPELFVELSRPSHAAVRAKLDLFVANGQQWLTTEQGRQSKLKYDEGWFRADGGKTFPTIDAVYKRFRTQVDNADLEVIAARWRTANQQQEPKDAVTIAVDDLVATELRKRGYVAEGRMSPEDTTRAKDVEVAVKRWLNTGKLPATTENVDKAFRVVLDKFKGQEKPTILMGPTAKFEGEVVTRYGPVPAGVIKGQESALELRVRSAKLAMAAASGTPYDPQVSLDEMAELAAYDIRQQNKQNMSSRAVAAEGLTDAFRAELRALSQTPTYVDTAPKPVGGRGTTTTLSVRRRLSNEELQRQAIDNVLQKHASEFGALPLDEQRALLEAAANPRPKQAPGRFEGRFGGY